MTSYRKSPRAWHTRSATPRSCSSLSSSGHVRMPKPTQWPLSTPSPNQWCVGRCRRMPPTFHISRARGWVAGQRSSAHACGSLPATSNNSKHCRQCMAAYTSGPDAYSRSPYRAGRRASGTHAQAAAQFELPVKGCLNVEGGVRVPLLCCIACACPPEPATGGGGGGFIPGFGSNTSKFGECEKRAAVIDEVPGGVV